MEAIPVRKSEHKPAPVSLVLIDGAATPPLQSPLPGMEPVLEFLSSDEATAPVNPWRTYEGLWGDVAKHAMLLGPNARVRLIVLERPIGKKLEFGALPAFRAVTDDDFKGAEYHPADEDL